ncbi:YPO3983 family protein [Pseudescherichia vulneris]|uniref:YPO3983 family protein n=1 Tax=Pseudescherichia vulneris TaxID=566 RepID=UPI0028A76E5F|nr:YPO3983 family protein [Pseudescherichia vulneris]
MTALQFPCTIFKTQKWMDDYGARDMRYGDLTEAQLRKHYHLENVSTRVNPYTLTKVIPFSQSQLMPYGYRGDTAKMTPQQCARILFDEFRHLSRMFALFSPYRHLIDKMITHMQYGNGAPFRDMLLDRALKEVIVNDSSQYNSTRLSLKKTLFDKIDWSRRIFPESQKLQLYNAISSGILPKFDRFQDNFNGMGITVHDTWATQITIKSLHIDNDSYQAVVHYKVQDHFGLDDDDIMKNKFSQFRFFRIWFILQRYNLFGFKPFITNIESDIEIIGGANEL